jgi:hypothetical protein
MEISLNSFQVRDGGREGEGVQGEAATLDSKSQIKTGNPGMESRGPNAKGDF